MDKLSEILEELLMVLSGRSNLFESLLPPVFFVLLNAIWDMQVAIRASLGLAVVIATDGRRGTLCAGWPGTCWIMPGR